MKTSQVVGRLLDAALIACLILGSEDVRTFTFWIVSCMVGVMFFGLFSITLDLAKKMRDRSIMAKAAGIAIHVLYVAALIFAGFPVLAAMYAIAAATFLVATDVKLTAKVKP